MFKSNSKYYIIVRQTPFYYISVSFLDIIVLLFQHNKILKVAISLQRKDISNIFNFFSIMAQNLHILWQTTEYHPCLDQ